MILKLKTKCLKVLCDNMSFFDETESTLDLQEKYQTLIGINFYECVNDSDEHKWQCFTCGNLATKGCVNCVDLGCDIVCIVCTGTCKSCTGALCGKCSDELQGKECNTCIYRKSKTNKKRKIQNNNHIELKLSKKAKKK